MGRKARKCAVIAVLGLCAVLPGSAHAAGGKSIATAPTVVFGQQQVGNTATDQFLDDSCFLGFEDIYVSYWLVGLIAGDHLTIDYEGVPGTELILLPVGTTDFNVVGSSQLISDEVTSNGKARATYTASASGVYPLYFSVCEDGGKTPGPYAFTATAQHGLFTALTPTTNILKKSTITGTATLADGSPAPDGLAFNLVAKWHSGRDVHRATTTALTVGGTLAFKLQLPPETGGKVVRLGISRSGDAGYLAAKSAPVNVRVARGKGGKRCAKGFRKKKVGGKVRCVRK